MSPKKKIPRKSDKKKTESDFTYNTIWSLLHLKNHDNFIIVTCKILVSKYQKNHMDV